MSVFDKDTFLSQQVSGGMSTEFPVISEHDADAYVKEVGFNSGTISKGDRAGEPWAMLVLHWVVESEQAKADTNRDEPIVRQSVFLDLHEGMIDNREGKNIQLGRIRAAMGQNGDGPWNPMMLEGGAAHISITQRPDDNDPSKIYNDVGAVTSRS